MHSAVFKPCTIWTHKIIYYFAISCTHSNFHPNSQCWRVIITEYCWFYRVISIFVNHEFSFENILIFMAITKQLGFWNVILNLVFQSHLKSTNLYNFALIVLFLGHFNYLPPSLIFHFMFRSSYLPRVLSA